MHKLIPLLLIILSSTLSAQTQRRVLLEIFSTERCNNCAQAHKNIERIFGDGGDSIVMIVHHAGFYTDDYTIPESVDYEWFYTPNRGTYAPAAMMDRSCFADAQPTVFQDGVPVFNGAKASYLQAAYQQAVGVPAYAKVEVSADYQTDSREMTATITGRLLRQLPTVSDLRLNVFVAEDSVFTQTQSGSVGSYYHRHMARHCFTSSWGEPVAMDDSFSLTYTLTLPTDWNADKIAVIAFLSNYNPNDRNNCQVLNTATVSLSSQHEAIIKDISDDEAATASACYTLSGIRHEGKAKGLSIRHGRVVFTY